MHIEITDNGLEIKPESLIDYWALKAIFPDGDEGHWCEKIVIHDNIHIVDNKDGDE